MELALEDLHDANAERKPEARADQTFVWGEGGDDVAVLEEKPRDVARIEEELSDALTAKVEIRIKKRTKRGVSRPISISWSM